jgi:acyl-CoA synthetase (AMP-forming)/AMP-acid ligase II
MGEVIRAQAALRPHEPAMVGSSFATLRYSDLQSEIDRIRGQLRGAGLGRDARIAVAVADSAQAALAIIAVASSAVAVPLDPKLTAAELDRCMRALRPAAVLVLRGASPAARAVAQRSGLPLIEAAVLSGDLRLELAVPSVGPAQPLDEPDAAAPAFILHTSGTTAQPNLVPFSHRNLMAVAERLQTWFELSPADRCLNVSPVYYSHALTTTVIPPLLAGGSVAYPFNPTKVDLVEWLGALQPTWYSAGPTLQLSVLEKARELPDPRGMHRLRFISSAGAALQREVHAAMQDVLGVPVLEHYGSSETAQLAANQLPPRPCKPGTCGVPWPDTIMIVGEDGGPAGVGEQGDILARGPSVMDGYLDAPELNRARFSDGWFRTGDVGSLDRDGFLILHGRRKEIINRGGEKIAPVEIDQALLRHPEVEQAAAFAVPHPRLGEDVAAAVVLRPAAKVTPAELREMLGRELASFKVPRRISVLGQLPRGITGKVQRGRLSEMLRDGARSSAQSEDLQINLLGLWRKFLKNDNVSAEDDFFEKGGDSILAMEMHAEVQRIVGRALPETILFEAASVRDLMKRLALDESSSPGR